MSCGCGGECCQNNSTARGLGFLLPSNTDWVNGGRDDGWNWHFYNLYSGGWGGWGGDYSYDYITDTGFLDDGGYAPLVFREDTFAPAPLPSGGPSNWWDYIVDFFSRPPDYGFPPAYNAGTPPPPPLPGYCPAGTYHPLGNPYICVPFPDEIPRERDQRQQAARRAAQQRAAQQAAQRARQAAQPCPPNTGLVKNAQGQCVCPPGLAFSKSQGKCVLVSQLTEADKKALEKDNDWLKWLLLLGIVVVGVKVVQGSGKK